MKVWLKYWNLQHLKVEICLILKNPENFHLNCLFFFQLLVMLTFNIILLKESKQNGLNYNEAALTPKLSFFTSRVAG